MPFVLYDDQFPHHPKVAEVKVRDRAALALHVLCGTRSASTTPGLVSEAVTVEEAGSKAKAKRWAQVLVDARLWHAPGHDCDRCPQITAGYVIHDWEENGNLGAEDLRRKRDELSRKRSAAGAKGAARRWQTHSKGDGKSVASEWQPDGNGGGKPMASDSTTPSSSSTTPEGGSVGESSSVVDARARSDDEDLKIEQRIITELAEQTGHTITPEHAAAVRRQILDGRPDVRRRGQYVVAAIRGEPRRYLPADAIDPASRTPAEAIVEAVGGRREKDPDATERGAAAARAALRRKP